MEDEPHRHSEKANRDQTVPGPRQCPWRVVRLDWENGDHEIVAEPGVAQEGAVFGIFPPQSANECQGAKSNHQEGHGQIHRRHGVPFNVRAGGSLAPEIGIKPLRAGPKKAESGLNGGPKIRFCRRHLVQKQREIQRHDAPDQSDVLEGRADEFNERGPVNHARRSRIACKSSAITSPRGFAPWFPFPCKRTLTFPASISRAPMTNIVCTLDSSARRILPLILSALKSLSARTMWVRNSFTRAFAWFTRASSSL